MCGFPAGQHMSERVMPDSGRAHELTVWIARHGVATVENLSTRFGYSERAVRHVLRSALGSGLLRECGVLAREDALFVATRTGLRAAGLAHLNPCTASPRAQGHLRVVAATAVWLECALAPRYEVLNERELRARAQSARTVGARHRAGPYVHHAGGAYKRADLLIRPRSAADGLPIAVEVELSRKSAQHLRAICAAWRGCHDVAAVLYVAAPSVLEPLRRAIGQADAQQRITVLELEESDVPALRRRCLYRSEPGPARVAPARLRRSRMPDARTLGAIRWVARWGLAGVDSLGLHLGIPEARVRALVRRAAREELLRCAVILRHEPLLCWATRRGMRAAGLAELQAAGINYCSAARCVLDARIAAVLERERPDNRVISRRELDALGPSAPESVRRLKDLLRAPAHAAVSAALRARIVVLRTGESSPLPTVVFVQSGALGLARLRPLAAALAALEGVAEVIVYVTAAHTQRTAGSLLSELGASDGICLRMIPTAFSRQL
jgi:hypothetical protein